MTFVSSYSCHLSRNDVCRKQGKGAHFCKHGGLRVWIVHSLDCTSLCVGPSLCIFVRASYGHWFCHVTIHRTYATLSSIALGDL